MPLEELLGVDNQHTFGLTSFSIIAQASVACPACAAIFPLLIFRLSFTTSTIFTSSVRFARTLAMSEPSAAASSSASESESLASTTSESEPLPADDGPACAGRFWRSVLDDDEIWRLAPESEGPSNAWAE